MSEKEKVFQDLTFWFRSKIMCPGPIVGVLIFALKDRKYKVALAADDFTWNHYQLGAKMPFSAQPSKSWSKAILIGKAQNVDEAMKIMFNGIDPNN